MCSASPVVRFAGGGEGRGGVSAEDALRLEVIAALRDIRQQLGAARCREKLLREKKEQVRIFREAHCLASPLSLLRRQAEAEARLLKAENEKLHYRVTHLVRSLKAADEARPPPPHPPLKASSTKILLSCKLISLTLLFSSFPSASRQPRSTTSRPSPLSDESLGRDGVLTRFVWSVFTLFRSRPRWTHLISQSAVCELRSSNCFSDVQYHIIERQHYTDSAFAPLLSNDGSIKNPSSPDFNAHDI